MPDPNLREALQPALPSPPPDAGEEHPRAPRETATPLPLRSLLLLTPAKQALFSAGNWFMPGLLLGVYLPNEQFPLALVARGLLGAVAGALLGALSGLIGW